MSKLAKLRGSPTRFFAESKHRIVRGMGLVLAPQLERPRVLDFLEEPGAVLERSRVPGVARLVRARERRGAARRRALIAAAGTPRVSVIMAAYDAASTIEGSLASLLGQTHAALEVLVVDDGSADETADIVRRVAAGDARVRLIAGGAQRGAAMARNLGLSHASGEYLSFHDADDWAHPEKLERQLAALLEAPDAVACVCNFRREFADGRRAVVNGRRFARNVVSMVFRRAVFERIGYMLDMRVGEDTEYYERIRAYYGRERVLYLFRTLYRARFAPRSLLFSNGATRVEGASVEYERSPDAERLVDEILERAEQIKSGILDPFVPMPA